VALYLVHRFRSYHLTKQECPRVYIFVAGLVISVVDVSLLDMYTRDMYTRFVVLALPSIRLAFFTAARRASDSPYALDWAFEYFLWICSRPKCRRQALRQPFSIIKMTLIKRYI